MISDCQIVVVEDEGTERAMTVLEALLRLPTEARGGRPERCEEERGVPEFEPVECPGTLPEQYPAQPVHAGRVGHAARAENP